MATEETLGAARTDPAASAVGVAGNVDSQAAGIRADHIGREEAIKSIGLLCFFSAFIFGVLGAGLLVSPKTASADGSLKIVAVVYIFLAIGLIATGWGLRALKPWSKFTAIFAALFSTFLFPFSAVVSVYILWLVFSKKGRYVLSSEYAAIVAAAPAVEYRQAGFAKVFMVALAVIIVLLTIGYFFG